MKKSFRFTLIELLVVIAIIAILAAMLLPALGKVKSQGHTAHCHSQLKQLGVAFNLYRNASNDFMPRYNYNYLPDSPDTRRIWSYFMWKLGYLKGSELICPAKPQKISEGETAASRTPGLYDGYGMPYDEGTVGSGMIFTGTGGNNANVSKVRYPSLLFLAMDVVQASQLYKAQTPTRYGYYVVTRIWRGASGSDSYGYPDPRHDKAVNVVMLDGHTEKRKCDISNPYKKLGSADTHPRQWFTDAK